MHEIQVFAPYAVYIITLVVSLKIFARTDELAIMKSELLQYVNTNFVKDNTYNADHEALRAEIAQLRQDISEVKTLLIGLSSSRNNQN